jgi:hypothetical protein
VLSEYLSFARIAQRLATRHRLVDADEWRYSSWEDVFNAMRRTSEGHAIGIHHITPTQLRALGTNGIQQPIKRRGNRLVGTERIYDDSLATDDGRARFVARDQQWTTVWQSGYTFRYLTTWPPTASRSWSSSSTTTTRRRRA